MRAPGPAPADSARDADLLDGWKDIADYLGKSVRTAQRWKAEFGLPVHHLGGRDGEGVYAFRSEIDRWRRPSASQSGAGPSESADPESQPGHGDSQADGRRPAGLRRRLWRIAGVLVLVAALAALVGSTLRPSRQPASLRIENGRLVVLDATEQRLWDKTFARPLDPDFARSSGLHALVDLDGDGRTEVVIAVPGDDRTDFLLRCYESGGRELWTYRPAGSVTFGRERLGAPRLARLYLHKRPDGSHALYVVSVHHSQFASLVARLGPGGAVTARYWSAGHVTALRVLKVGDRNWVFVGAPHNETKGGSLAVFDERRFGGSAPARKDAYRCMDCPAGSPDFFYVSPRTSISRLFGFAPVTAIDPDDDAFSVSMSHRLARLPAQEDVVEALAHYRFDAGFSVIAGDYVDGYYVMESFLVAQKLIPKATAQQDKSELWPVEVWSHGRWESVTR